jgi:multicomponent K+:H+ antiporter subunit G
MSFALELLLSVLLVLGGGFGLIASIGLWRLGQPMQRLHAPTKAGTLGLGSVLVASAAFHGTAHEVVVLVFVFLTAPVSAMYLAKTHLHLTLDRTTLPPTGTAAPWATLDAPSGPVPTATPGGAVAAFGEDI